MSCQLRCARSRQQDLAVLILGRLRHVMLHVILVVIVGFEELLDAIAAELLFALANLLGIFPLLIVDVICVEVIYVNVRNVR